LAVIVLSVIWTAAVGEVTWMPPPRESAVFPEIVLPVTVSFPLAT
jgi:hypothetical protein